MVFLPSIRRKYMVSRRQRGAEVSMSECVVTLLDRNTHEPTDRVQYTGSAQTLDVSVTWEGAPLAVNTDYTLSWANNTNVGPATVTVTGTGQFSGGVTKTFYVVSGGGSVLEWTFDLADSSCVGSLSLSGDYARSISLGRDDGELFVLSTAGAIRKVTIPSNGTIANATIGGAAIKNFEINQNDGALSGNLILGMIQKLLSLKTDLFYRKTSKSNVGKHTGRNGYECHNSETTAPHEDGNKTN